MKINTENILRVIGVLGIIGALIFAWTIFDVQPLDTDDLIVGIEDISDAEKEASEKHTQFIKEGNDFLRES